MLYVFNLAVRVSDDFMSGEVVGSGALDIQIARHMNLRKRPSRSFASLRCDSRQPPSQLACGSYAALTWCLHGGAQDAPGADWLGLA